MDADRSELRDHDIRIKNGEIVEIGANLSGSETLDASNAVVTPGLVNTHHHMFQSLVRGVPAGQDALLFLI